MKLAPFKKRNHATYRVVVEAVRILLFYPIFAILEPIRKLPPHCQPDLDKNVNSSAIRALIQYWVRAKLRQS